LGRVAHVAKARPLEEELRLLAQSIWPDERFIVVGDGQDRAERGRIKARFVLLQPQPDRPSRVA
jgi:hypothetical protein